MNVMVDEALLEEARHAGGHRTGEDAVHAALREYVRDRRQRQLAVLDLFGRIEYEPGYDPKRLRSRS